MRGRISLELPSDPRTVSLCRRALNSWLEDLSVDPDRREDVLLAVSEATGNVVRHAYGCSDHPYQVCLTVFSDRLLLEVSDQGIGFNRATVPDPNTDQLGGRGLWIIEQLADLTTVSSLPGGGCRLAAQFLLPRPVSPLPATPH